MANLLATMDTIRDLITRLEQDNGSMAFPVLWDIYQKADQTDVRLQGAEGQRRGAEFELRAHEWLISHNYKLVSRNLIIYINTQTHAAHQKITELCERTKLTKCYRDIKRITKEIDGIYEKDGLIYWVEMKNNVTETLLPSIIKLICMVYALQTLWPVYPEIFAFEDPDGQFIKSMDRISKQLQTSTYQIIAVSTDSDPRISMETSFGSFVPDFQTLAQDPNKPIKMSGKAWEPNTHIHQAQLKLYQCLTAYKTNHQAQPCYSLIKRSPRYQGFLAQLRDLAKRYDQFRATYTFLPTQQLGQMILLPKLETQEDPPTKN